MKLRAEEFSFMLEILGYEFPGIVGEDHDSNWLVIRIHAHSRDRSWKAQHPCLLTWEVSRLAEWLETDCAKGVVGSECGFKEPSLEFHVVGGPGEEPFVRIYFELEMRPDRRGFCAGQRDCWVEFPVAELDLHRAAQDLREQLARFPERK